MNVLDYVGFYEKSTITKYCGTDNGQDQNPRWNIDFDYRWNSLGFRGEDLKSENPCIITFGCSNTIGVGVPEEMRFSRLLADHLRLADYNFGSPGADVLVIFHNILAFFKNHYCKVLPKYCFILWPNHARFTWSYGKDSDFRTKIALPNMVEKDSWQETFMYYWAEHVSYPYLINMMNAVDTLFHYHNIPLLQLSFDMLPTTVGIKSLLQDKNIYDTFGRIQPLDRGRDLHIGPLTHKSITDIFLSHIT